MPSIIFKADFLNLINYNVSSLGERFGNHYKSAQKDTFFFLLDILMFIYYGHGLFILIKLFDFWKYNTRTLLINMEQNSHENVKSFNITTRTHQQCHKENEASVGLFCTLFESFHAQLSTRCHFYAIIVT